MASDDIWILGIHMTKFGKHPDKDVVDLASEAAMAALADGGVTMKDIGVLAAGNLMSAAGRSRPADPEADRPDRHPRLQRRQRVRDRCHRAAHRDHGREGGRDRRRSRGRRREALRRRAARGWRARRRLAHVDAARSLRRGRARRRPHRHRDHAGRVRADRHGVRPQVRRHQLRAVRRASARRTTRTRR